MSTRYSQSPGTGPETDRRLRPKVLVYALAVWMLTVAVAIANATFREVIIAPSTTELTAHQLSTVTLIALLVLVAYVYFTRWTFEHTRTELLAVGVLWLGLTVAFELLFGHYVAGDSWSALLKNYDLLAGYVWVFVPLTMLVSALIFGYYLRR